jgi:hypothetical protein
MGAIDRYLDELFDRLAGTGAPGRRALAEAEDHLRSAAAEGVSRGLSEDVAEFEAVHRFGPAARVARGLRQVHGGLVRPLLVGTWLVGCLGALAVGLSGLLAEAFGRLVSPDFVAGDGPGITYTPARCADYYEYVPGARSCAEAAAVHHWGEVVDGRVALGVLGLLGLVVFLAARRWGGLRGRAWTPPAPVAGAVLLALFALAGLALSGASLMQMAFGLTTGAGANLSAGLVALAAALAVLVWVARRTRHESTVTSGDTVHPSPIP